MALMLKSNSLVKNALKTSYSKPLLDYILPGCGNGRPMRNFLSHCAQKNIIQNYKRKYFLDVTRFDCVRFIQQTSANVVEEERLQRNRARQPFRSPNISISNELDKAIFKLDLDVRRTGRLSKLDVENISDKIQAQGKATNTQGLLIIRSCGALLPEEPRSSRIELSDKIWKTLQETGCPLDVSHYNALLKVYLENEQPFSPIDFLSNMEQKGIEPNRVTYQRLIGVYCQKGDIDGASKILEFMKEKELAVNEMVFNELIYGHAKANDMNGAKDIIEVMKNSKLDPSSNTYFALAQGYALSGNLEAIIECIEEAEKNDVFLTDKDYLNIVRTLAINSHIDKIDNVLSRVKKNLGYNQECINVSMELINDCQDDVAFKILMTMPRSTLRDGTLSPAGHFLIKQMVKAGRPAEKVLEFCKKLEEMKLNDDAVSKAAETSLTLKKPDHALLFIREMAAKGFPIRNHYFWPILIEKGKEGEQAVYDVLKVMCDLGCPPSYETFMDYALPYVTSGDPKIVIQRIKDHGQTAGAIVNPLISFYLSQHRVKDAQKLLEEYPVRLNPSLTTKSLAFAMKQPEDIQAIIKILEHLKENPEVGSDQALRGDWCGQFLMDYAYSRDFNLSNFQACLNVMLQKNLQISHSALDSLRSSNRISSDVISVLENLASDDIKNIPGPGDSSLTSINHPNDMDLEELENHLVELRSKGMNTRGVLRRLLLLNCRKKNADRVMEIKGELDQDNFVYSAAMYATLMELFVFTEKVQEALEYKKKLDEIDSGFKVDDHKILNLAALMVKEGLVADAIELITKQYEKFGSSEKGDFLVRNVYRLLNSAAEKGDIELTNKLFDLTVIRFGYAKPNNVILGSKIKACLAANDYARALKEFELCASNYKQTPWKNEIFRYLISNEDSENLQKVVDISNEIHGEVNVLYDLACSFIESNRVKQAKKIMETPGLRAYNSRLDNICNNLIEKGKINDLEQLVVITKDLFDINRDMMYYNLLKGYIKENNVEKGLGVWTSMQEEDIQPSVKTMIFLSEFLTKNNQPIPFEVPSIPTTKNELSSTIGQKDLEKSFEIKTELEKSGVKIENNNLSKLVELCVQRQKLKDATRIMEEIYSNGSQLNKSVLRYLFLALAREGNVETMERLRNHLQPDTIKTIGFDNILCNAYINRREPVKFIEKLEQFMDKENFPSGGILGLLDKCPELEPRIISLANKYYKELGYIVPMNMIWQYYMVKEDFANADKLYKSFPEMKENLMFGHIRSNIRKVTSLPLAEKLISVIKDTNLTPKSKALAYSSLISALVKQDRVEEALQKLEEATVTISLSEFTRATLIDLSNSLKSKGKSVPFEVPKGNESSSSSSSDSSDDEKSKK